MQCNVRNFSTLDPFRVVRRDFERQLGMPTSGPAVNLSITESDSSVTVEIDVPGVPENDLSVTVHEGQLIVEGERIAPSGDSRKPIHCGRIFGKFRRVLKLDDSIDPDSVEAVLANGVLAIVLSRRPEVQPRKINVRSASL